jgi:hypothetical protein
MNRKLISLLAVTLAAGSVACENALDVRNQVAPSTEQVLGTPNDAEALLGTYYKRWNSGVYNGSNTSLSSTLNLEGMANVMSLMNYSSLANNCQNSHTPFTGYQNVNSPGNTCLGEQFRLWSIMHEVERVATSFLTTQKNGLTLGTPARDARAAAFAEFLRGLSIGYVALMHDSVSVVSLGQEAQDPGKLIGYRAGMDSALAAMDRALAITNSAAAGGEGFPLPSTWIPSPTSWTKAEFSKLIRSYSARLRANVARTPAERAAVEWPKVIADAQNGLTADNLITTSTTVGPGNAWRQQYGTFGLWHQMPPFFIGMADTSGSYAAWIAQPISERGAGGNAFFMVTPDLRFPQGLTRAAQQADFSLTSCQGAAQTCKRYFVNRGGNDQLSGAAWGSSNYDFARFHSWVTSGDGTARNGNTIFFTKAENDLLLAEGLYRTGNLAGAGAIVNVTRVRNGLPAITDFSATAQVPGGNSCVPKVPVAPSFTTVACGTLWDALKYEKRIETAYTHYVPWFLDGRGWGELPFETPLYWAVPYQDLQARGTAISAIYGTGVGAGNAPNSTAARSVYGW